MAAKKDKKSVKRVGAGDAPRSASEMVEDREALYPRFSDPEYARCYTAIRAEMGRRGLDALMTSIVREKVAGGLRKHPLKLFVV